MNPELKKLLDDGIKTELKCINSDPLLLFTKGKLYKVKDILLRKEKKYFIINNNEDNEISIQITEASKHFEDTYHDLLEKLKNIKNSWK